LEHFWCMNKPWANTNSQNSPWSRLEGSHHLPLYSILYAWSRDQHPNVIWPRDSQVGVSKFQKLRLPWLWRPITLCADLLLKWDIKQSYNPCWEFFNNMWHATCTQINWGNSWLLLVRSQIDSLTPNLSFGHNFGQVGQLKRRKYRLRNHMTFEVE
jgi:hypothetical protein